jgi:ferric-dicitrate binding protein FerR (iron transport regulator)
MLNNDLNIKSLITELSESISEVESTSAASGYTSASLVAAELEDAWDLAGSYKSNHTFDAKSAFKNFQNSIATDVPSVGVESAAAASALSLFFSKTATKVVAVAATVALVAGFWFLYPEKYTSLANETEQIKTFAMQDGSIMTMFPGSIMNIFGDLNNVENKVSLEEGQIYADVKVSKNPLVMNLAGNQLLVSGTVFAAETDNDDVVINVFEGQGVYYHGDETYQLSEGTKLVHSLKTNEVTEFIGADKTIVDFTRGSISFVDTPLEEVFSRLGSFYNVDFDYDVSKVSDMNFTSAVLDNQNLESIIETIEISFDLEASKVSGNNYKVTFK